MADRPVPFDEQLPDVKDMLNWDQAERLIGFRNDYRAYRGSPFTHGAPSPLPTADRQLADVSYTFDGATYGLREYLDRQDVTGLLVLAGGSIVHEYYGGGNTAGTLWTSRSVGKSVVSTLVGVALQEGRIGSLDDPLTRYDPELTGTAWEGVDVRQLMQHTSGVAWNEDYRDPTSDFSRLTHCEAGGNTYRCVRELVHSRHRPAGVEPGQVWSYSSGGAWLLGDVLERAVGMSIGKYLEQRIWIPFGMADDGVWHCYVPGVHDCGAHGFNATLRDWGRFGQFILGDGVLPDGRRILPDGWVRQASDWNTAAGSVSELHPEGTYGYQWWNNSVPGSGRHDTLWALGIFGQILAVNQRTNLVMVQWSTWPVAEPSFDSLPLEAALMFEAISDQLAG